MKKIIALLLAVMMVLAMAACAAKTTDTPAPAETDNKTDAVQETATEAAADGKTAKHLPTLSAVLVYICSPCMIISAFLGLVVVHVQSHLPPQHVKDGRYIVALLVNDFALFEDFFSGFRMVGCHSYRRLSVIE